MREDTDALFLLADVPVEPTFRAKGVRVLPKNRCAEIGRREADYDRLPCADRDRVDQLARAVHERC